MSEKPLAYEAFQQLAEAYAAHVDTKPHNAYYDRPAVLSMLPDVRGRKVLDLGCGPGVYAEALVARGASVIACDVSERMLELAKNRLKGTVDLRCIDISKPMKMFGAREFDVINAPLCLDYIEDWQRLFAGFARVLKPGGVLIYSCGHPSFDAEYFKTEHYFSVERVECTWTGFGETVRMPSYRRSLEEVIMPLVHAGFVLERVLEPRPTDEFKAADPIRYASLMHRPGFICIRARKPSSQE